MTKGTKNFIFSGLALIFFFNIIVWKGVFELNKSTFLEVNFFDVGQGDSIFIETPKRQQILIDAGPGSIILEKLSKEMPFWDRTIDLIILTHPEKDHLAGLIEVLKSYTVENILWTGVKRDTSEAREWEKLIKEEGAKIFIARADQKITWQEGEKNSIEVLYPFENFNGKVIENSNNTSVVAKLIFGGISFLFTGDIQRAVEKELTEKGGVLDSDVLKLAHHGSKTSSSEEFLGKVTPEIVVIQVGKDNQYGHPHQEVLERLKKYGIKVLRTDKDSDIKIISDSKNFKAQNL